jgi:hypothetical protein
VGSTGTHRCTRPPEGTTTSHPRPHQLPQQAHCIWYTPASTPWLQQVPRAAVDARPCDAIQAWQLGHGWRCCAARHPAAADHLHHSSIIASRCCTAHCHQHSTSHTPWANPVLCSTLAAVASEGLPTAECMPCVVWANLLRRHAKCMCRPPPARIPQQHRATHQMDALPPAHGPHAYSKHAPVPRDLL